jgi:hypothetical protein
MRCVGFNGLSATSLASMGEHGIASQRNYSSEPAIGAAGLAYAGRGDLPDGGRGSRGGACHRFAQQREIRSDHDRHQGA